MAKQFIYAAINPIWMNPVTTFAPEYNTVPFDFQQPKINYAQKYQTNDGPILLQVLSDWLPVLKIYDAISGQTIDTINGDTPVNGITGETFTLYEFSINWGSYATGVYFIQITYTDDSSIVNTWQSGLIETKALWPRTLLFAYNNSYNAFSAIFSTGIVFKLRVEGNIADFAPAFEDVIYNDQEYNVTKLNAIPRREFNLYIASTQGFGGVPPWMGDKMNWVMACDQIAIDGMYYQNISGSKWEISRTDPTGTNFIGLKIAIIEVINLYLQQYQAGTNPAGGIQVVTRSLEYIGISANITIAGVFKTNSVLVKIIIYNLGGDIFTLNCGTAADGSVPITTPFTTSGTDREVWFIDEPFSAVKTVYITGLAGTNCNIFVLYEQLDAPIISPITSTRKFAKGTRYTYEEVTVGDFEIHWNIGTGEGNPDTDYEGCVLSGTNGTKDMNGLIELGWNSTLPLTRDLLAGNTGNLVTVARANLPAEGLNVNALTVNASYRTGSNSQHAAANEPAAPLAKTENMGSGVPLDISNAARISVRFVCITD